MIPLDKLLHTPRLSLVPITPALAAAAREGEQALAQALGARVPDDWRASSLQLVGRSARPSWHPSAPIRAIVIHRAEACAIGDVRFEPCGPDEVEIGYSVAQSRRRQGYATEAAGAVIDWLFQEGGAAEIIAGCERRNVASVRTLRKLGFWLDGARGNDFWWLLSADLRKEAKARV